MIWICLNWIELKTGKPIKSKIAPADRQFNEPEKNLYDIEQENFERLLEEFPEGVLVLYLWNSLIPFQGGEKRAQIKTEKLWWIRHNFGAFFWPVFGAFFWVFFWPVFGAFFRLLKKANSTFYKLHSQTIHLFPIVFQV